MTLKHLASVGLGIVTVATALFVLRPTTQYIEYESLIAERERQIAILSRQPIQNTPLAKCRPEDSHGRFVRLAPNTAARRIYCSNGRLIAADVLDAAGAVVRRELQDASGRRRVDIGYGKNGNVQVYRYYTAEGARVATIPNIAFVPAPVMGIY